MTGVIVVPCFNEAERWNLEYWEEMLALPDLRWLFVDDGSTDSTATLIEKTARLGDASTLELQPNAGKAEAVRRGMLHALKTGVLHGPVGFMDADGAFSSKDVADLLEVYARLSSNGGDFDAVWSSRVALAGRDISRSTGRHYLGRGVATLVSLGELEMPYDTQSGLKLFKPSEQLLRCLERPFRTRWLFELELLSRFRIEKAGGLRIWEEPLNYWHDVPGSKITARETLRIFKELTVLKRLQHRARRMTVVGHR